MICIMYVIKISYVMLQILLLPIDSYPIFVQVTFLTRILVTWIVCQLVSLLYKS
jgi:hypothetical protein